MSEYKMSEGDKELAGKAARHLLTCSTCSHWKETAFGPVGLCGKITENGHTSGDVAIVQGGGEIGGEARLLTMPEFGCILHQPKNEHASAVQED
jgi:hypothetical protein